VKYTLSVAPSDLDNLQNDAATASSRIRRLEAEREKLIEDGKEYQPPNVQAIESEKLVSSDISPSRSVLIYDAVYRKLKKRSTTSKLKVTLPLPTFLGYKPIANHM